MLQKIGAQLKKFLNPALQSQYKAGFINGGLETTDEGKEVLLDIVREKFQDDFTAKAEAKILEEEKAK